MISLPINMYNLKEKLKKHCKHWRYLINKVKNFVKSQQNEK